jgi:hypothetical protein
LPKTLSFALKMLSAIINSLFLANNPTVCATAELGRLVQGVHQLVFEIAVSGRIWIGD